MLVTDCVNQPHQRTNRNAIADLLAHGGIQRVDVAVAYVTTGGARDLLETMRQSFGANWGAVQKRWLIAFDYCRTEPVAAKMLKDLPQSTVKVHDGARVVAQKGAPTIPFHPKAFLFRGPGRHALFAGSGNLSRSGLNTGHEVGLLLDCRPPADGTDAAIRNQIAAVQRSGSGCLNNFPRFISGLRAGCVRCRVVHGGGRRLRRTDRRGGQLGAHQGFHLTRLVSVWAIWQSTRYPV